MIKIWYAIFILAGIKERGIVCVSNQLFNTA